MTETVQTQVHPTPKVARNYTIWNERDIDLLLSELEKPGAYKQWKENKSSFAKGITGQEFSNPMNQEAIKFKIRWLESRFKSWHEQLTLTQQKPAVHAALREKMMKEFPYYDRCKPILGSSMTSTDINTNNNTSTNTDTNITTNTSDTPTSSVNSESHRAMNIPTAVPSGCPYSPSSSTSSGSQGARSTAAQSSSTSNTQKILPQVQTRPFKRIASNAERLETYSKRPHTMTHAGIEPYHLLQRPESGASEQFILKTMEYDLEFRKMEHDERMQQMKLEQLKLEIELQKLRK
ncbi:hypothetical protein BDF20DRAFT_885181 [Mycotypha africana]|uniref:uncharacterized protein n=1 Tax=Mycotypha africana TaxID=64632 RepID=UPI002301D325|nr:uncharacterized protein BDF20DRAFT_885181 [Mycotypha africana]KAI8971585.1 hypothetical protein BDF20DRAFT_885181 [Mycotypha africana]